MSSKFPWNFGKDAVDNLTPEMNSAGGDTAGIGDAMSSALGRSLLRPSSVAKAAAGLTTGLARIPLEVTSSWLTGSKKKDPRADRRFSDPAWTENPYFHTVLLNYMAWVEFARTLVDESGVDRRTMSKARVGMDLLLDSVSPTNFFATNPAVMKRAFETGGASVVRGLKNFAVDMVRNGGRPQQADTSAYEVGRNLAMTPAKVVYRNDLIELLQYEPQTEKVHATPLLCSPPWINKYYIMDLAPSRSFIEWAVKNNRTVFAISYRNPTGEMSGTTFDDYLVHGPAQALEVITEITGSPKVDLVGLCLGGALASITTAFLRQSGDDRIGNVTLLNTMLDYTDPGPLAVFTDEAAVVKLEELMAKNGGGLPGKQMAGTFDVLRANDLIFNYVVSNWLMGDKPPAFDILSWNGDSTNMPGKMHAFYLRNFYVKNLLAKGQLEIAGKTIDLGAVDNESYVVSAVNDHIVPWKSAFKSTHLFKGESRFVLSNGGHIAGIVNPPNPKSWYQAGVGSTTSSEEWSKDAKKVAGSWWLDWNEWQRERAGELVAPPKLGSRKHKVLGDGPGEYVRA